MGTPQKGLPKTLGSSEHESILLKRESPNPKPFLATLNPKPYDRYALTFDGWARSG